MRRYRFFAPFLAVALLAAALFGSAAPTRAQDQGWTRVAGISPTVEFHDVFMFDVANAWAAGEDGGAGVIYHLSRTANGWLAQREVASPAPLRAIVVASPGDIWAAGDAGLVRRVGAGWQNVTLPVAARLNALQLFGDGSQGWAGGASAPDANGQTQQVVLRLRDGGWRVDSSLSGEGDITSLHFSGANNGWAVGSSSNARDGIWHYHNGRWSAEDDRAACDTGCLRSFARVRAIDDVTAWAVGTSIGMCAICLSTHDYLIQRAGGPWGDGLPYEVVAPFYPNGTMPRSMSLAGVTSFGRDDGLAVGSRESAGPQDGPPGSLPQILRYRAGGWSIEPVPAISGRLNSVSMIDASHALAAGSNGLVLSYGYPAAAPAPTGRVDNPRDPAALYFDATGHTLRGRFRQYWEEHGGLMQFGYPLTEEYVERSATDGQPYVVQYYERARFEYHPENQPPYDVLLGLLGRAITAGREGEPAFQRVPYDGSGRVYFPETGHHLAPEFLAYWQSHGGLAIYGYPISEPLTESNEGATQLVQYFERNRFEYHPENRGTPYEVLLGRLGAQVLGL